MPLGVFLHFPPYFAYSRQGHASDNLTPPKGTILVASCGGFLHRSNVPSFHVHQLPYMTSLTMPGNTGFKSRYDTVYVGDFLQLLLQNAETVR
jgi:hypothetical protein